VVVDVNKAEVSRLVAVVFMRECSSLYVSSEHMGKDFQGR
jgi:hypothetical protein